MDEIINTRASLFKRFNQFSRIYWFRNKLLTSPDVEVISTWFSRSLREPSNNRPTWDSQALQLLETAKDTYHRSFLPDSRLSSALRHMSHNTWPSSWLRDVYWTFWNAANISAAVHVALRLLSSARYRFLRSRFERKRRKCFWIMITEIVCCFSCSRRSRSARDLLRSADFVSALTFVVNMIKTVN